MAFLGDNFRRDYFFIFILVLSITDLHRHFGLPYVYLDRQVFDRHKVRFLLFPAAMFALFIASPFLSRANTPLTLPTLGLLIGGTVGMVRVLRRDTETDSVGRQHAIVAFGAAAIGWVIGEAASLSLGNAAPQLKARHFLNGLAVFAGLWNIWHVYNQKYGIFRLYNAKSEETQKVPGWVDRLLIWGWLPLYFFWLSPRYDEYILRRFSRGRTLLTPVFDAFNAASPYLIWPSIALVLFSIAAFLYYERKVNHFRNAPRLWMLFGTTILASSFLWLHPLKAYLAYAFSHALEYNVFVWAFQRRRYHSELSHKPVIGKMLKRPGVFYLTLIVSLVLAFGYLKYFGRTIMPSAKAPKFLGFTTASWIMYWTVYQSMVHFYFDGFLWKMRLPTVRASI